jgi:hypothetical protein
VIGGWALVYALGLLVIGLVMLGTLDRGLLEQLTSRRDLSADDLESVSEQLAQSLPAFLAVMLLVVALTSIITGGIFRAVLRPQERGFLHLRLGPDEFRLTLVNLILVAIGLICFMTGIVAVTLATQTGSAVGLVSSAVVVVLTVWVGVRLCLVTPMTFATGRIAIAPAWELSRGRFWSLLGMIALSVIFYIMVLILMSIIVAAVVGIAGGPDAVSLEGQPSPIGWVALLISLALQLVLQVLQIVMIYGPFAVAYQQLSGHGSAEAF